MNQSSPANIASFAPRLLTWFDTHGRHDLPWQQHKSDTPDAYPVWLSEVMLQQTQVSTVIPYFLRFMQSFPTVQDLATAEWDTVAEHWAGLGYYARARNLHKGAKQLVEVIEQTGDFPQTVSDWEQISGVGRSTAGAVVAMGLHRYGVICDGNVKRVLTRWAGIDGDITKSATNKQLWALAESLTPKTNDGKDSGYFAQAMMDMGATVCNRTKPACLHPELGQTCPLQSDCTAYAQNTQRQLPFKAKKQAKPSKLSHALMINNPQGQTLWLQRPESGIWGGLWCLPLRFIHKQIDKKSTGKMSNDSNIIETANHDEVDDQVYEKEFTTAEQIIDGFINQCMQNDGTTFKAQGDKPAIKHTLTHFHWFLKTQHIMLTNEQALQINELLAKAMITYQWLTVDDARKNLGLPTAMVKLL